MKWIVVWGITAIAAAALAAAFAGYKNRGYSHWIAWSFLFPPIVIWLMLMPRNPGVRPRQPTLDHADHRD